MKTRTKLYVVCPACGEGEVCVQHLVDDARAGKFYNGRKTIPFGPWGCDNHDCGVQLGGEINEAGEVVNLTTTPRPYGYGYALLKFGEFYLVYSELQSPDYEDSRDYFYHSHQCPTNILHSTEEVFTAERGKDPHGRIRYVASIPETDETREALEHTDGLAALFALFKTDGQPIDTDEWPEENGGVLPFIADMQREYAKSKAPKA